MNGSPKAAASSIVVLDLAGVVFDYDQQRRLHRLSSLVGVSTARLDELFWRSGFVSACDSGEIGDADAVRREIRARVSWDGPARELDEAWCSAMSPGPAAVRALKERPKPGPRLAVLTNNGPLEELTLPRLYPEVFDGFEALFFSHRLGATKPAAAVFAAVTRELAVSPGEVAFLDDNRDNVAGARRFGWQASIFESVADIIALLNAASPPVNR